MSLIGKKWVRYGLVGIGLLLVGLAVWVGPVLVAAKRAGLLDATEAEKYQPSREANLKAIATALNLVHDSDGAYPKAENWMDAIGNRLQRNGMTPAEAQSKLTRPGLDPAAGQFGYAYNRKVAGKYRDDLPNKDEFLVTESRTLTRNFASDGNLESELWGVTVQGKLVKTVKQN
jgi:hypothetical protein